MQPQPPKQILQNLIDATEFMIIGHRGAAGLAPENTLESFATALNWGCPMVELDVYACRGQQQVDELVVIHDDKLNRTTNGRGRVMDHSVEELRQLDAGNGQPIPMLSEVVQLLEQHDQSHGTRSALNIELKGPKTAAPTAQALTAINNPVLVSSFDHAQLHDLHELDPTQPVAPLYDRFDSNWKSTAQQLEAIAVNLSARIANTSRVAAIRDAGLSVFVYTVNTVMEADKLRTAGANGVFTDRPDVLMRMLD